MGTVSDNEGKFTFDVSQEDFVKSDGNLIVSYIGYIANITILVKEKEIYNL